MRRFFSKLRRGLCSTSEDAIIVSKQDIGSHPINAGCKVSTQIYTIDTVTDFDDLFEDDGDDDVYDEGEYPWTPTFNDNHKIISPSSSFASKFKRKSWSKKEGKSSSKKRNSWQKLDDEEVEVVFSSSSPECTRQRKVFQAAPCWNNDQQEAASPVATQQQQSPHQELKQPVPSAALPVTMATEERQPLPVVSPEHSLEDGEKKLQLLPATYTMDFPVTEIKKRVRTMSDDVSSVSELSVPRNCPLEFNLEKGFSGKGGDDSSAFFRHLSEDIVQSLERTEYGQHLPVMQSGSRKCLILLMSPKKKLFEIVPVPYEPMKTTVGDMMGMIKELATDHRLAKQEYTGLAYQGMHISASTVPIDVLRDAAAKRKPLLAVPIKYSAGQVELLGKSLLESSSVSRLLEDQLTRLDVAAAGKNDPKQDLQQDPVPPVPTSIEMNPANASF